MFGAGLDRTAVDFRRETRIVEAEGEVFRPSFWGFSYARGDLEGDVARDVEDPKVGRLAAFFVARLDGEITKWAQG